MSNQNLVDLFSSFRPSTFFISVKGYENNEGEVSNFSLLFHISYRNLLLKSLAIGEAFKPSNDLEIQAKEEIIHSINSSLEKYKEESIEEQVDNYQHFKDADGKYIKGIKQHIGSGDLHLYGYLIHKQVLKEITYKEVKSKQLTIIKNKIKSNMPVSKWRQFKLAPNKFQEIGIEKMSITADPSLNLIEIVK